MPVFWFLWAPGVWKTCLGSSTPFMYRKVRWMSVSTLANWHSMHAEHHCRCDKHKGETLCTVFNGNVSLFLTKSRSNSSLVCFQRFLCENVSTKKMVCLPYMIQSPWIYYETVAFWSFLASLAWDNKSTCCSVFSMLGILLARCSRLGANPSP